MYGTVSEMYEQLNDNVAVCAGIIDACKSEGRVLTDKEKERFDDAERHQDSLDRAITLRKREDWLHTPAERTAAPIQPTTAPYRDDANTITGDGLSATTTVTPDNSRGATTWALRGSERCAVSHGESCRSLLGVHHAPDERSPGFGRLLAHFLGRRDNVDSEISLATERRALGEAVNSAGGFLVDNQLASQVFDLARNKSIMSQAGAITMIHDTERFEVARVTTDPTMSVVAENATIPEGSIVFGRIGFTAVKVGTIIKVANELIQDANNLPALLEQILAEALGTEIDRLFIDGSDDGEAEPAGLVANADVTVTDAATGSPTFDDILDARLGVENNNGVATGVLISPTNINTLAKIKDSQGNYLIQPERVASLNWYVSKNVPDTEIFVGGFENAILGLRMAPRIFSSEHAGMASDQTFITILARFSFGFNRSAQIAKLAAVTT